MSKLGYGIAVIESRWYEDSNLSVRYLYDFIHHMDKESIDAYHYEMASSTVALKEAIIRLSNDRRIRFLVLAMHSHKGGLSLANGEKYSRKKLVKLFNSNKITGSIVGLHVSACGFVNEKFAKQQFSKTRKIRWVSGYQLDCDFADSTYLEGIFFNRLFWDKDENEQRANANISKIAKRLDAAANGLIQSTGFNLYKRSGNNTETVLPKVLNI